MFQSAIVSLACVASFEKEAKGGLGDERIGAREEAGIEGGREGGKRLPGNHCFRYPGC